jgi:hypothetical protein
MHQHDPDAEDADRRQQDPYDEFEERVKRIGATIARTWKKLETSEKISHIISFITLLALTFYAGYTVKIYRANHDAAKSAQETLGEIQKQTTLMRQQVVGTQAAILQLDISFGEDGRLGISLNNLGRVTADLVQFQIEATKGELPGGKPTGAPITFSPPVSTIQAQGAFIRDWTLPWRPKQLSADAGQKWPQGWPGKVTYIFRSKYSYQDGFGDPAEQATCRAWLPRFTINYKLQGSGGGGLIACDDLATVIHSVQEQEKTAENGAEKPK